MNLQISDSYKIRNEMLSKLHSNANSWFALALARAPIEFQSTLQVCLMYFSLLLRTLTIMFLEISLNKSSQVLWRWSGARGICCPAVRDGHRTW